MIRIVRRIPHAGAVALCGLLALPGAGWASSGGTGLTPGTTGLPANGGSAPIPAQSGTTNISYSGDGITLDTVASAPLSAGLAFIGAAAPSAVGQEIEIERSGPATGGQWVPTVSSVVSPSGLFGAVWTTDQTGRFQIRAIAASSSSTPATVAQPATAASALTVTVYGQSRATLYGPGFYGRQTACGQKLTAGTIGVASRTLSCGSAVAIYYGGRTLTVPVIDRGPYANGASWDLTMATARALGITGTAEIGAVSLPSR